METIDLAYYAGLIDGEGYIGIHKSAGTLRDSVPRYQERLTIGISDRAVLLPLGSFTGGNVLANSCGRNKQMYRLDLRAKRAREFLALVRPYLRVKAVNADAVLSLHALAGRCFQTVWVGDRTFTDRWGNTIVRPVRVYPPEHTARMEALYLHCKSLNHAAETTEAVSA